MLKLEWIMIIGDDDTSNYITKIFLSDMKVFERIDCITEVKEAMAFFTNAHQKFPDLILLDISISSMNGFELLEWFEQNSFPGTSKFVMLTESVRQEDRDKAQNFRDVIGYIEKPIDRHNFIPILAQFMDPS